MLPVLMLRKKLIFAFAGCLLAAQAHAVSIPDPSTMGPALAANVTGVYSSPPTQLPTTSVTDAAVTGNGDMAIMVGGPASALSFYVGKSDFWGVLRRFLCAESERGASYHHGVLHQWQLRLGDDILGRLEREHRSHSVN